MAETYGERPRPWILAVGVELEMYPEHREALDALEGVTVDYVADVRQVSQHEYDVAVVVADQVPLAPHLDAVLFQAYPTDHFTWEQQQYRWFSLSRGLARRTRVPEETPPDIRNLAAATLVPWVDRQEKPYRVLIPAKVTSAGRPAQVDGPTLLSAFLVEAVADGDPIAGRYRRPGGGSESWLLPLDVDRVQDWLELALSYFAEAHPERFPDRPTNWTQEPAWMTSAETTLTVELHDLDREERAALDAFGARRAQLQGDFEAAHQVADAGPRRLLTSQGDDLVEEVETTLQELGFKVLRPDEERAAAKDALLEDLEVVDGDWNTLVEVRGYAKGGGKTQDLQRIERFVAHYVKRTGSFPSARWYVVNHSFSSPPDARPRVLRGSDEDTELFAEAAGLVVDTRDLFRLRRAVAESALSPDAARELLRGAAGIFEFTDRK